MIVTTTSVVYAGVFDQAERHQPSDRGVERAGAHAEFIAGAARDVENDAVAVAILDGQRQQDVELLRRKRKKGSHYIELRRSVLRKGWLKRSSGWVSSPRRLGQRMPCPDTNALSGTTKR